MLDLDVLFGTEIIEALQSTFSPAFTPFFVFFTLLGEEYVYMSLIAIMYWCIDKKAGVKTAYILLGCAYLNYWLKMSFRMDKPPSEYRIILKDDISYGFPSGHVQNAATFWGWLGLKSQKSWMHVFSSMLIASIGLSRIYLGAHYLGDVLGGALFGTVFLVGAYRITPYLESRLISIPRGLRSLLIPLLSVLLFGLSLAVYPDTTRGNSALICGTLLGFSLGVLLESRHVNISMAINRRTKAIRAGVGLGTVFGVSLMLSLIANSLSINAQPFIDFLKYAIIALTVSLITPLIFRFMER